MAEYKLELDEHMAAGPANQIEEQKQAQAYNTVQVNSNSAQMAFEDPNSQVEQSNFLKGTFI